MRGLAALLAWIAGAAWQLQQPALWPVPVYAALCGAGLSLLGLLALLEPWGRRAGARPTAPHPRGRTAHTAHAAHAAHTARAAQLAAGIAACVILALGSTGWRAAQRLAEQLPAALEGEDLELTGVVSGLPQPGLSGVRFVFDVESARHRGTEVRVPVRVALGWYRGFDADAMLAAPAEEIRAGQRWRLVARLRQPHGTLNPHGFDLELWLFEQGLRASGYVRATASLPPRLLDERAGAPVQRLRQRIRDAIFTQVDDPVAAGVIAALAVGDQGAIERDEWDLFRVTGVAHLMSISGLHVTMFAWLAGGIAGWLWRRRARWLLALPAQQAARWGGLAAAFGYALLAGWGVPAQRTVWMLAAVVALRALGWRWPAPQVLAMAGAVVIASDPWALLQPGFWLSFVAVGLLIVSDPARDSAWSPPPVAWRRALADALRTQAVASVGLAPLTLVFFQQLSLVGFAANLFAIPFVTLLVTPLALAGVLLPLLWTPSALLVQGLLAALGWAAQWPGATWQAAVAPAWAVAAGLAAGIVAVLPWPWRLRLLALPLALPLLWPPVQRPAPGEFEALVLDVGQGTAVLVRTHAHLLVYDAGPQYSPEADAGQRVLLPLLRARGERAVDLLMLSHRDTDHVGGAATLLRHAAVREVSSSLDAAHPLRQAEAPHRPCEAGQRWQWDGVDFEVLHPAPGEAGTAARPNTLSCVLRVQDARGRRLLLTGDIEAAQEARLVRDAHAALASGGEPLLASEWLVVPHHGSRTSSTAAFLDAVSPRTAVVQAAYRSRFGHPAPDVVARYAERGVELLRTDRCGAALRRPDGSAACQRRLAPRYWHHRAADPSP